MLVAGWAVDDEESVLGRHRYIPNCAAKAALADASQK